MSDHAVGWIEMGLVGGCLVPFIDFRSIELDADLVNYGTAGTAFHGLPQRTFIQNRPFWNSSWFPDATGFPFGEEWEPLARTIGQYGGAETSSPFSFWVTARSPMAWNFQQYYQTFGQGGSGFSMNFAIQNFSAVQPAYIEAFIDGSFQGSQNNWEAVWNPTPAQMWADGDIVGISFDPTTGDGYAYVNDTRYELTSSARRGAYLSPGPEPSAELIALSNFNFNGEDSGFIPPKRFSVAVGMITTGLAECGDAERIGCYQLGWIFPSLQGIGDGRIVDLVDVDTTGRNVLAFPNDQVIYNLSPFEDEFCDLDVASWRVTTGDFAAIFAQQVSYIQNVPLNGPVSDVFLATVTTHGLSISAEFIVQKQRYPNGLAGLEWISGAQCRFRVAVSSPGGSPLGYSVVVSESLKYDGALDVAGTTSSVAAAVASISNRTFTSSYGTDAGENVQIANFPLSPRDFTASFGPVYAYSDTYYGASLATTFPTITYWEGYPR